MELLWEVVGEHGGPFSVDTFAGSRAKSNRRTRGGLEDLVQLLRKHVVFLLLGRGGNGKMFSFLCGWSFFRGWCFLRKNGNRNHGLRAMFWQKVWGSIEINIVRFSVPTRVFVLNVVGRSKELLDL